MRTKLLTFLFMAGTVVGCASNPPPPPPMAMAAPPPPAPAPVMMMPTAGKYMGMADATGEMPRGCKAMKGSSTATVRGSTVMFMGMRGMIEPDGTIKSAAHRGGKLSGMATASGLDVMATKGRCTYHYMLTQG